MIRKAIPDYEPAQMLTKVYFAFKNTDPENLEPCVIHAISSLNGNLSMFQPGHCLLMTSAWFILAIV